MLDELNVERRAAAAVVERAAKERERPKDASPVESGACLLCFSFPVSILFCFAHATLFSLCVDSPTTVEEVEGPVQTDDFRVFEASVCEEGMILSVND